MNDILGLIDLVTDATLRQQLKKLYSDFQGDIETMPASVKHHHNWTGGYHDHVSQVILRAMHLYKMLYTDDMSEYHATRVKPEPYGFSWDDVILVAYIHDLDKLFRYKKLYTPRDGREWDYADVPSYDESAKVTQLCYQYGIQLSDLHLEALAMHHGGWSANNNKPMSPLAVIIHSADLMSTFITNHKGD